MTNMLADHCYLSRFDFTNKSAMNVDQVRNVERIANEMIDRNEEIYAKEAPLALAKSIQVFDQLLYI